MQNFWKVTSVLTRNHADVLRVFRQMVFNIARRTIATTTPRISRSS